MLVLLDAKALSRSFRGQQFVNDGQQIKGAWMCTYTCVRTVSVLFETVLFENFLFETVLFEANFPLSHIQTI